MKTLKYLAICALPFVAMASAIAAPQLAITEIYVGTPGDDITADWIELTNFGDMAWDVTANPLWYDDISAAVGDATAISNISSIAPNESVVVILDDSSAVLPFFTAWDDSGQLTGVQIGWSVGAAGLGQTGDAINIFDDLTGLGNIIASQGYATEGVVGSTLIYSTAGDPLGNSINGVNGAYSAPGGPAGDAGEFPLIGSPGAVPEPATIALLGLGAAALIRRR